jgi:hypothetical protein
LFVTMRAFLEHVGMCDFGGSADDDGYERWLNLRVNATAAGDAATCGARTECRWAESVLPLEPAAADRCPIVNARRTNTTERSGLNAPRDDVRKL